MNKPVPGRYAVIKKDSGIVTSVKDMQGGKEPTINEDVADQFEVVNVSGDVRAGMMRQGDQFVWPDDSPPDQPKGTTKRQEVLGSTTEPRTVRNHPTKTGTPGEASNKQPSEKTQAKADDAKSAADLAAELKANA